MDTLESNIQRVTIEVEILEAIEPGFNYKNDRSFIIAANIDPIVENTNAFSCFVPLDEAYCDVVITTIHLEFDET